MKEVKYIPRRDLTSLTEFIFDLIYAKLFVLKRTCFELLEKLGEQSSLFDRWVSGIEVVRQWASLEEVSLNWLAVANE